MPGRSKGDSHEAVPALRAHGRGRAGPARGRDAAGRTRTSTRSTPSSRPGRLGVRRRAAPGRHAPPSSRVQDGEVVTTDGPFAETKEQLGGFWVIEAPDLDAALALAAKGVGRLHGARRGAALPGRARGLGGSVTVPPSAGSTSTVSSGRSPAGPSPPWSASSATSTSPRRRSRRRSSWPSQRWPDDRPAAQPGRLDHHHGPQPGHRPAAPGVVPPRPPRPGRAASTSATSAPRRSDP